MRAYIDESGHEQKGWMFLAGFVGNNEQWTEFVPIWKEALGPQRKLLHMNQLRWKKDRTRRLLERLGPVPSNCKLIPMLAGVRYQDYEDLVSGTPEQKLLKGYIACLAPMVIQTLRGIPKDETLELVFEEQQEYASLVDMSLAMAVIAASQGEPWSQTPDGKPKLAKWGFVKKGSTIMTDPADYLAFALREVWTNPKSQKARWCHPILKSGNGEGFGVIMQRPLIRRMIIQTRMRAVLQGLDNEIKRIT